MVRGKDHLPAQFSFEPVMKLGKVFSTRDTFLALARVVHPQGRDWDAGHPLGEMGAGRTLRAWACLLTEAGEHKGEPRCSRKLNMRRSTNCTLVSPQDFAEFPCWARFCWVGSWKVPVWVSADYAPLGRSSGRRPPSKGRWLWVTKHTGR